jgi:exopolysaccharide production protein ExoZ
MNEYRLNSSKYPKIECIQFLRFVASFLVLLTHSFQFFYGSIGVDIFFVISGFIMMYASSKDAKKFLIKRIVRIVPLYWTITILFFLVMLFFPILVDKSNVNFYYLIKSLLFIPYNNGEGYFPVIFLGWTLNYEMVFYILFGFSIFISKKYRFYLATFLIIVFLLINRFYSELFFFSNFYGSYIIFEFIFGMLIFNIWIKYYNNIFSKNYIRLILFVLFSSIIIYFLSGDNTNRITDYGIPASLIVFFFLFCFNNNKFPSIFVLLGNASYSLYLTHPYIIQITKKLINFLHLALDTESVFIMLITTLFSIIFALVSFKFFEKKIDEKLKKYLSL